jgi:hypothetical protein
MTVRAGHLAVLVGAASLAGCLYDQPVAPGTAEAVDAHVLGTWKCVNPEGEKVETLTVTERPEHRYRAEFDEGDDKPSVFVGYAVTFGSERILNVQEFVHGEPRKWTLARFTLHTSNVLRLEAARHDVFGDATTADQREKILAAALKSGVLFADFCVCIRAAKD